jgi:hypothetical protein
VSGHLAILVEPAYPDRRKPRNSASMFRMRGAGLSRPLVNIMHPAVTYCRHEVHGPCRIHYSRTRSRNVCQSRYENVSMTLPESRVSRTITRPLPEATSTQLDSKQADDLRQAKVERSTSAIVGSSRPDKTAPPGQVPRASRAQPPVTGAPLSVFAVLASD